jgi:hypothetical protein
MTTSHPRWFIIAPIVALLFAGVAAVAFSLGATSGGFSARVGQPATIPGQMLGPGRYGPSTVGGAPGQLVATISKVDGSKLSLQATDGWTRTVDATGATVTKGGQTIALSDLKVGDRIVFREARQSDGTYKIATIQVLAPAATGPAATGPAARRASVLGTVASKTATSLVVTAAGGKTITVNVSSATRYSVRGVAGPTLADIAVGDRIAAQGTLNSDGSLAAAVVQTAPNVQPGSGGGRGFGGSGGRHGWPVPVPSAGASAPNV